MNAVIDKFLLIFNAYMSEEANDLNTTYHVQINVSENIVADIQVPTSLVDEAEDADIGQLITTRLLTDVSEGVVEALHRADPDRFANFEDYQKGMAGG